MRDEPINPARKNHDMTEAIDPIPGIERVSSTKKAEPSTPSHSETQDYATTAPTPHHPSRPSHKGRILDVVV